MSVAINELVYLSSRVVYPEAEKVVDTYELFIELEREVTQSRKEALIRELENTINEIKREVP